MNKNITLVFIVILVVAGAIVVIQQKQSTDVVDDMEIQAFSKVKQIEVDQAKQAAFSEAAKRAEAEKARIAAVAEAEKAKLAAASEIAKQNAAQLQAKVTGLLSQARSLLDSGKFQETIDLAKNILSQDPNNAEAKSILETATAKLKEFTQQQIQSLTTQEPANVIENIDSQPGVPGE